MGPGADRLSVTRVDGGRPTLDTAGLLPADRLLDEVDAGIVVQDLDCRILRWSRGAERLYGWTAREMVGTCNRIAMLAPGQRDIAGGAIARTLAGDGADLELWLVRKDGTRFRGYSRNVPIRDEHGAVAGMVGITIDVTDRKRAEDDLRFQARLLDEVDAAVVATDPHGLVTHWNRQAEALHGRPACEMVGRPFDPRIITGDRGAVAVDRGDGVRAILDVERGDGTKATIDARTRELRERGMVSGYVAVSMDISDRVEADRRRREAEERYRAVIAALEEGVLLVQGGRVELCNAAACRILGIPESEIVGNPAWHEAIELTYDERGPWSLGNSEGARAIATGRPLRDVRAHCRRPDGRELWVSLNYQPLPAERPGDATGLLVSFRDITERRRFEAQLEHRALHDALTGLANRALFLERLEEALEAPDGFAVLYVDLDGFKRINDGLGHLEGDLLLVEAAKRLRAAMRPGDLVARLGGDEFAVLAASATDRDAAAEVAAAVGDAFAGEPFRGDHPDVHLSGSIGIALRGPGEATTAEALLRSADQAMYRAKDRGRGEIEVAGACPVRSERLALESDLRRAIAAGDLWLAYQPVLDLHRRGVIGHEALLRWHHPVRGEVPPSEFVAVAEEAGLIVTLGEWVLRRACADAQAGLGDVPGTAVAVNLSARQFADPCLADTVAAALAESGLAPHRLCLEITETAAMRDAEAALGAMRRLRSLGVRLAIDDFGTGFSSLSYLKRFPVDVLKVDREFVDGVDSEPEARSLVAAMVTMAEALGLRIVAEGVETPAQRDALRELGCRYAQGFLYARPLPAGELASAHPLAA